MVNSSCTPNASRTHNLFFKNSRVDCFSPTNENYFRNYTDWHIVFTVFAVKILELKIPPFKGCYYFFL